MLRKLTQSTVMRRRCAPLFLAEQIRFSTTPPEKTTDAAAGPAASDEPAPPPPQKDAEPVKAEKTDNAPATPDGAAKAHAYRFPTEDVLKAVKKGDFGKVQSHASELVQKTWRDEYSLPAACGVIFIVAWYWMAWTRRSVRRKCVLTEDTTREEARQTVDKVKGLVEQWKRDMSRANAQMQGILDKNSQLTKDIDRMTTALRSCSIRPTPGGSSMSMRTEPSVDKVKQD